MKNVVLWDVTPRASCKNRYFGETCRLHHQGDKYRRARKSVNNRRTLQRNTTGAILLLVTANIGPSSHNLVTLMMEATSSSESSVITRATRRKITVDGILLDLNCLCSVICRFS
jgi:hypothetical protein